MKYIVRARFNPNHHPAGAPGGVGGQFASSGAATSSPTKLPPGSHPIEHFDWKEVFANIKLPPNQLPTGDRKILNEWHDILDDETWEPHHQFPWMRKKPRIKAGNTIITIKFNPYHMPAGSPEGGQFATVGSDIQGMAEFNQKFGPFHYSRYGDVAGYVENDAAGKLNKTLYPQHDKWFYQHPQIAEDVIGYTQSDYMPLNNFLRTGNVVSDLGYTMDQGEARSEAARLERTLMYDAPTIPDGTVLYRAFRSDSLAERAANGTLEGGVFQDQAFLSTTTNPAIVGGFYQNKISDGDGLDNTFILRMTTHDDIRGLYTQSAYHLPTQRPGEYEVLLNKSTPVYVSKVTKLDTGAYVIDADVYGHTNASR